MRQFSRKQLRAGLLGAALVVALAAAVMMGGGPRNPAEDLVVAPTERGATRAAAQVPVQGAAVPDDLDIEGLRRARKDRPIGDLFVAEAPPPAGNAIQGANAAPSEQALPFQYLGKMIEDGRTSVFLARGEESLVVRPGQTIEGQYRVDSVSDAAVSFTHLPSGARKTLTIAAPN